MDIWTKGLLGLTCRYTLDYPKTMREDERLIAEREFLRIIKNLGGNCYFIIKDWNENPVDETDRYAIYDYWFDAPVTLREIRGFISILYNPDSSTLKHISIYEMDPLGRGFKGGYTYYWTDKNEYKKPSYDNYLD